MSTDGRSLINLVKSGKLSLEEVRQAVGASASGLVSVENWGVCYSSATGQLSEYCTVTSNDPNNPITGVGMLAYTGDGSTLLCAQYTNDFNSTSVATSVGTTGFNPQSGNQVLCVVYGWTANGNYYLSNTLTIVPC